MYCPKCNSELPNEAKFCTNCGESFAKPDYAYAPDADKYQQNPQQATPAYQQMPVQQVTPVQQITPNSPVVNNTANQPKKKGKGLLIGILVAVLVVALGVGGFLIFWMTRPSYKINKALNSEEVDTDVILENFSKLDEDDEIREEVINYFLEEAKEEGDFSNVSELYELLSEDEQETVSDELISYANSVYDSYCNERISYDEWTDAYDAISDIIGARGDLATLFYDGEELYYSRECYQSGIVSFENEEYEEAIEYFNKVIPSDKNYDDAQDKIALAEKMLIPPVTGTWYTEIDLGPEMSRSISIDDVECVLEMDIVFNDDNTGMFKINEDSIDSGYDMVLNSFESGLKKYLRDELGSQVSGLSDAEFDDVLDEFAESKGFSTFHELCEDELPYSEFKEKFNITSETFTYELTDTLLIMDGEEYEYELNGDVLTIYGLTNGSNEMARLGLTAMTDFKKR